MSIRKMIALHPDVAGHVNQPLGDAAHHLMYCARMCVSCADACAAEKMDMAQCIRSCLDCADVCEATGKLAVRRTGSNEAVLKEMLEFCARVCDACAAECERHDHRRTDHRQLGEEIGAAGRDLRRGRHPAVELGRGHLPVRRRRLAAQLRWHTERHCAGAAADSRRASRDARAGSD